MVDKNFTSQIKKDMEETHKGVGYVITGLIIVGVIAYFAGVSAGKASVPIQEHTDSEYVAVKACYDYISTRMGHINTITTYLGSEPSYEVLANAMNQISTYDENVVILSPSAGGYSCP